MIGLIRLIFLFLTLFVTIHLIIISFGQTIDVNLYTKYKNFMAKASWYIILFTILLYFIAVVIGLCS